VILGGTFLPVADLPAYLRYPALAMPVTHLVDAMEYVVLGVGDAGDVGVALGALGAFAAVAVAVAALVIRRAR